MRVSGAVARSVRDVHRLAVHCFSSFGGSEWQVAGVICLAISVVVFFLLSVGQNVSVEGAVKNWKKASLVIAPRGMAMVQGEIEREIALLLGIKQPEVSHLMNGQFNRFTTDKLLDFLKRLDRKVTIQISQHRPGNRIRKWASASEGVADGAR